MSTSLSISLERFVQVWVNTYDLLTIILLKEQHLYGKLLLLQKNLLQVEKLLFLIVPIAVISVIGGLQQTYLIIEMKRSNAHS